MVKAACDAYLCCKNVCIKREEYQCKKKNKRIKSIENIEFMQHCGNKVGLLNG
jgi:hypothetical protein